ncbi:hypothetical protein GTP45_01390 [Pseudoduganella sp. FT55W]|uniref:FimV N-terminal domain-containing protein n=1 Tax=Duganella rivi TaxID=2666083 RepID=A0A7X4GL48_9BURK|nr:hypothetical protein [Duganella rivi]MYM65486.1 hypothetical protein [Duganella rivi]
MMQYKHLTTSICLLALAGAAQAAELGDVAPRSYIGQPLAVDIDLVSLTPEEAANLPVRLAQADVYRGANVSMNPALSSVRMQVERRGARQILHVTTTRAVEADYVHLYVELGAPGKSEVRLATVWLQHDPNPPPPPQPVVVAPAAPPIPLASAMTPAQAEQITAQARAARAAAAVKPGAAPTAAGAAVSAGTAAAKPAAVAEAAPVRDRTKPAPLPSVHEAETGKPGEVKAAGAQAQARRIAGVLVAADGKPIKPSDKEEVGEVPMSVSQALLPLAPLPLPKGVKRPAPASCPSGGMPAKECVALDNHNTEIASKLTELEGKLKALQGALGGSAPAAVPAAAAPASAAKASAPAAPATNAGSASKAVGSGASAAASVGHAASQPVKAAPAPASAASTGGASAGAAAKTTVSASGGGGAGAGHAAAGGASSAEAGGKGASSARASASMAEQGETEAHAAKAAAGASAASAASGEAAASGAASASSVPTKQVRVLPKLKYKKEKEKPAEQASSNTIPLIAGGVGLLALLGGGFIIWRKKSAGKGPLKIWQGFRKKKAPEAAPEAEPAPESVV